MGKGGRPLFDFCFSLFSYRPLASGSKNDLDYPLSDYFHHARHWRLYSLSLGLQSPHKAGASRSCSGTYVVESRVAGPLKTEPIWGIHWWVISGFLFLVALTALSKGISVESEHRMSYVSQRLNDERLIKELGGVQKAEVRIWTPSPLDATAIGNFLPKKKPATIIIQRTGEAGSRELFADQAAGIILKCDPRAQKEDLIRVEIGRSYSLGFASGNDYQIFTHTPAEWTQRLFDSSPASSTPPAHQ